MTPVYWLETRLPAPFRYRYVSCLSSVRRLFCSKGYLGRPAAIVWDMWRVLPALSHVTRLSCERTVRTAVQRLGRRWPILLPGRVTMAASGFFAFARGLQFFYFRARSTPARAHTSWSSGIRHRASANRISGPYLSMGGYALPRALRPKRAGPRAGAAHVPSELRITLYNPSDRIAR